MNVVFKIYDGICSKNKNKRKNQHTCTHTSGRRQSFPKIFYRFFLVGYSLVFLPNVHCRTHGHAHYLSNDISIKLDVAAAFVCGFGLILLLFTTPHFLKWNVTSFSTREDDTRFQITKSIHLILLWQKGNL